MDMDMDPTTANKSVHENIEQRHSENLKGSHFILENDACIKKLFCYKACPYHI